METIDNIDRIIANYLSGEISSGEMKVLESWLESDPANEKLLTELKAYWHCGLETPYNPDYHPFLTVLHGKNRRRTFGKIVKKLTVPAAAVVAVGLFIVAGFLFTDNGTLTPTAGEPLNVFNLDSSYLVLFDGTKYVLDRPDVPREFYSDKATYANLHRKNEANKLIVARRNVNSITLPDGSHVTVNSSSWLTFPQEFDTEERRVKLSGEAYFDVVEEEFRPFIIELQKSEIMVLGTRFNIKSYDDDVSQVTLLSGSVRIHSSDSAEGITLIPGERATISDTLISRTTVDTEATTGWIDGKFYFDNTPLGEIAADLSRWYGIEVGVDADCTDIRISGTLDRSEPVGNIFDIIETLHPVIFEPAAEGKFFATRRDNR
ncbi:MAG: FecR domain-containing protein [Alistipes sp.]|nr:FecR domain-containing protein [Alistipes sp.]